MQFPCPDIGKMRTTSSLNSVDVKEVANAVWDDPVIIEEYLRSRKNRISEDDAAILSSWKRRIADDFILERHLKSGSVFISSSTGEVYLVSGIISSWEGIFYYRNPPIMINAVLVPFKNVIISDGLVLPYNMYFGTNAKAGFKEQYMHSKKNGLIHRFI
ncbi:MAG: hypothetical protein ACI4KO_09805 [Ruminiclostridium sp.]